MRRDAGDPGDVVRNAATQTQQDTSHGTPLVGTPSVDRGPPVPPAGRATQAPLESGVGQAAEGA